ncbi:MAG: PQQ-like beta-propeller repeat protein [Anaerolineales bacterium]|nr:PQQ-like beta-propeller repeat protein [Anaerolineales bacterium]
MKTKNTLLFFTLLASAILISSCTGARGVATSWPGLSVNEDKAYISYDQHVYAINLTNGLEQWRSPLEGDNNRTFYSRPTLTSDNQLLVGSYDKILYSLNPDNGVELWSYTGATDRYVGNPLTIDDNIYAPNADTMLYAINLQGNVQWTFETKDGPQWAQPISDPECTCIYLPSTNHRIYSIDALNGSENWQTEELGGSINGIPAFNPEGVLYVGTFASEMLAIDAHNGQVLWRRPTNDWVWGGPILQDDRLFFGDLSGTFYALDVANGQIIWEVNSDGAITDAPLVTEDTVYFNTEAGTLYAINLDGNTRWNKTIGGKLYPSPVLAGDLILVAPIDADALVYALDINGNTQWGFTPENN